MTARLLPPDKLTALLHERVHGATTHELAEHHKITNYQVINLLSTHRQEYRNIRGELGLPRLSHRTLTPGNGKPIPTQSHRPGRQHPTQDIQRKCNRCRRLFWTESRYLFSCGQCKTRDDWRHGTDFHAVPLRGMG